MQKALRGLVWGVTFVTLAGVGQAQFGPPDGRYQPDTVTALVNRVHGDLNRGYAVWRLSHGERGRLNHAERQLRDFEKHWRRGKFDQGNLNGAIGAVQKVVDKNHLAGRERDALWNDVAQLQRMREAYDRRDIGYR